MTIEEKERKLNDYIKSNGGVTNTFGKFHIDKCDRIGQGGNGLVYLAKINKSEVAIKFLISDSEHKITRFKSEYFNTNYVRNELQNIVNMFHYDELEIQDGIYIPYVIMNKYSMNLKKYRKDKNEITEEEFLGLGKFMLFTLKSIHTKGIIHRDIKLENILIDKDGNYVISDFGIAHYDKEDFPIDNKTRKGERLANLEFSAPEQINNKYEVTQASDIYSMGQIMYWFVFGEVNRGTGAESISQKYDWEDAYIYDDIINKCLMNNPSERFQSIEEICNYFQNEKNSGKELDPFEDMYTFHRAVVSVVPEFFNKVYSITDKEVMCDLFNSIFSKKYFRYIEFNTGIGNNSINSIIKLENNDFLMGERQLNIKKIWGLLTNSIYDDILLLEIDESLPYVIEDKEYYSIAVIDNEQIVPIEEIESGYVRYKGKVQKVADLNIQERFINKDYKVIAIAPFQNCAVYFENDKYLERLQKIDKLKSDDIIKLKKDIQVKKAYDVRVRL